MSNAKETTGSQSGDHGFSLPRPKPDPSLQHRPTGLHHLTILGIFPVSEVRTGGQKRYVELARQLVERGHALYHVCRPSMVETLPGIGIGVIPDELSGYLIPRWWRYRIWTRRGRREIAQALAADTPQAHSKENSVPPEVVNRQAPKPNIVLTFGESNYFAARSVADYFAAPLVFALRSNFVDEFLILGNVRRRLPFFPGFQRRLQTWWNRRLEAALCRGADRIVFQSSYDMERVVGRNPRAAARASVIPNSFRVSWLKKEHALTNHSNALHRGIYIGHLNERKGTQILLPALARLQGRLAVDIVGFGGLEGWTRKYVEKEGLGGWVTIHGRVDHPLRLLAAADLLIVPSMYDSFPNTVLEALFVGTPVIGSDVAGIRAILQEPSLLFPPGDPDALATRLRRLLEDPAAYDRVREACTARRASFDFDWAAMWEKLFVNLVREPAS